MAYKRKGESITAAGPRCKKQKTSSTTSPPKKPASRLLTLPAEIRNTIYEYTLHEHPNIWITPAIREPPLLSVNRQIRTEARGLYYSNLNTFIIPINHCDASLYLRFHAHIQRLGFGDVSSGIVCLSGMPHRANVLRWCKAVFEGGAGMVRFQEAGKTRMRATATYQVVIAGLEIARTGRESGLGWEVVRKMVGSLMYAVEEYDERWVDQCL